MEIINLVGKLPVHPTKKYAIRQISFIQGIIVHHTAGEAHAQADAEELMSIEQIARYHVGGHGWPGIGYHYVIAVDGTIYKVNNLTTLSYHAGPGENKKHVGICLMGNFEVQEPSATAMASLRWLIKELHEKSIPGAYVKGHREVHPTSCPGAHLFDELPR